MIHCYLIFFLNFRLKVDAHFQCMHVQLLQHFLLKLLFYIHGNTFAHLLIISWMKKKLVDHKWMCLFLSSLLCSYDLGGCCSANAKNVLSVQILVNFKIEYYKTSCFIPLLQKCFFCICPFLFSYNLLNELIYIYKHFAWNLIELH